MTDIDLQKVVIAVRYKNKIRWYRSDRDLWVLDVNKWRNEFIENGYEVPEFQSTYRFGIHTINLEAVERFLKKRCQVLPFAI